MSKHSRRGHHEYSKQESSSPESRAAGQETPAAREAQAAESGVLPESADTLTPPPPEHSAGAHMDRDAPEASPQGFPQEHEAAAETAAEDKTEKAATELTPEEKIVELEAQLADAKDQYLRKAADFENFRKRMNQEKQTVVEFANQSLLLDIIPIIDDFERALQAAGAGQKSPADFDTLCQGISMIEQRLSSQLESKWGLKRFNSEGEPFDPNRHEALMMEKSAEITEPVVAQDLIKGYMLKDRVIRSAKVKVVMPEENKSE
ncbi:MAG: nucleotide exchange factor GrpE [Treponema sp.]|jgi:molecular chaperone GrpE|nr:nucleotide exchange factor GrpE [Treponema sp.]